MLAVFLVSTTAKPAAWTITGQRLFYDGSYFFQD